MSVHRDLFSSAAPHFSENPLGNLAPWVERFASRFSANRRLAHIRFARHAESLVLGPDGIPYCVLVHSLNGSESIGEGMRIEAVCVSDSEQLPLKTLLGLPVSVWIDTDQTQPRCYNGFVSAVQRIGSDGGFTCYALTIEDGFRLLRLRRNCRVFTEMSVLDITNAVLTDHLQNNPAMTGSLRLSTRYVQGTNGNSSTTHNNQHYPSRAFVMQYNESDFDFLCRVWAREGLTWCVWPGWEDAQTSDDLDQPPAHTLVLFDDAASLPALEQSRIRFHRANATETADSITGFESQRQLVPGHLATHSWDYKRADGVFADTTPTEQTHNDASASTDGPSTVLSVTLEDYRHATPQWGAFNEEATSSPDNDHERLTEQEATQLKARAKYYTGQGSARRLMAGAWFELVKPLDPLAPNELLESAHQQRFLVSSVRFFTQNNLLAENSLLALKLNTASTASAYENQFQCVRQGFPIAMHSSTAPKVLFPLTAIVTGECNDSERTNVGGIYTDSLGRIKVRFPFVRGPHASAWVRVAQPWASSGFGQVWLPRIGDEVLVAFIGGDPDKPIVTGSLYNGQQSPAHFSHTAQLPGDQAIGGIQSRMLAAPHCSQSATSANNNQADTSPSSHQARLNANACNELLMDDSHVQLRTRLATDYAHSALNQGYLIHPRQNAQGVARGEGFELRTDAWGAVRAAQGLLLSTYAQEAAQSDALDSQCLIKQLKQQLALSEMLSNTAHHHNANHHGEGLHAVNSHLDMLTGQATKPAKTSYATYSEAMIAIASPAGIVQGTPQSIQMAAGKELVCSSQGNTHINAQGHATVTSNQSIGLFGHLGPIKVYAAKEAIKLQAQSNNIEANALKDVIITSSQGHVHIAASQSISLNCGGASICIENGNIHIHAPGQVSVRGRQHKFSGPVHQAAELPSFPTHQPDEYSQQLVLTHMVDHTLVDGNIAFRTNQISTRKEQTHEGQTQREHAFEQNSYTALTGQPQEWRVCYAATSVTPPTIFIGDTQNS